MGTPTHVQVIIKRARNLKVKGKEGTNDAFVIIGLGKEKYRTSMKEKTTKSVEWLEECELMIPRHGNTAEIVLKVMHQGNLGSHHFLGMVTIPLKDFDDTIDVDDRPVTKWYLLKCKPSQNKTDYRGDVEVTLSFLAKSFSPTTDKGRSFLNVNDSRKNKGSLQSLDKFTTKIGGSLISLGHNEKRLWKKKNKGSTHSLNTTAFSKFGGSLHSVNSSCCSNSLENLGGGEVLRKKTLTLNPASMSMDVRSSTSTISNGNSTNISKQTLTRVNEEEDEWNVKLSSAEQKNLNVPRKKISSVIKDFMINTTITAAEEGKKSVSANTNTSLEGSDNKLYDKHKLISPYSNKYPVEQYTLLNGIEHQKTNCIEDRGNDIRKYMHNQIKRGSCPNNLTQTNMEIRNEIPPPKPPRVVIEGRELSRIEDEVINGMNESMNRDMNIEEEQRKCLASFQNKSREDLIEILISLQGQLESDHQKMNEIEEYLASLLLKVLTNAPHILEAGSLIPYTVGKGIKEATNKAKETWF